MNELYGPLLGLSKDILSRTRSRNRIHAAHAEYWQCEVQPTIENRDPADPTKIKEFLDDKSKNHNVILEYDNEQMFAVLLPKYQEMRDLLAQNCALADDSLRGYLDDLVNFVDVWERTKANRLPGDFTRYLEHDKTADRVLEMYKCVEREIERTKKEMSGNWSLLKKPSWVRWLSDSSHQKIISTSGMRSTPRDRESRDVRPGGTR